MADYTQTQTHTRTHTHTFVQVPDKILEQVAICKLLGSKRKQEKVKAAQQLLARKKQQDQIKAKMVTVRGKNNTPVLPLSIDERAGDEPASDDHHEQPYPYPYLFCFSEVDFCEAELECSKGGAKD